MTKPRILIARTVFPEVVERLRQHFEVTDNQADVAWSKAEWTERLSQHVGAFSMGIDPVDEAVLQACPQLKICANMSVGYNNLDVPAMTRHGVLATMRSWGLACSTAASMRSLPVVSAPTLPCRRRLSSAAVQTSSAWLLSTSNTCTKDCRTSGKMARATKMEGLDII